jgi:hypothetical protein
MDADTEILKAEVVALQAVLIAVFRRMVEDRPDLAPMFCRAFDEADATLTGVAIQIGMRAPRETTVGALRVVEEIRAGVIRNPATCAGE